ncbi:fused response regulator/phosphatase [Solibacillus sp. FSL H8-0523]|uniref:fused response regulator/phosphatase n=1 Tax=Solibacillus sp. FSL H8-0523 TaxID=2954511 RepID=UPI003101121F
MAIVVVDDNQVNLFVMEKILRSEQYEKIVPLQSAKELFDYLDPSNSPHCYEVSVILLDIMMPVMDGIETCRILKQNPQFKDVQVIFVTALEDKEKLSEALDVGGIDYLTKPINKIELLARIRVAKRLKGELDWHKAQEDKIQQEMNLASRVQQSLLSPAVTEPNLSIRASYLPSSNLAGDMYYWEKLDNHRYAIMLHDMMGHGVSASLVCMYISSVLREAINNLKEPELVIREMNRYMSLLQNEKELLLYYFTGIYFIIDTKNKVLEYVNAGHPMGYALVDEQQTIPLTQTTSAVGFTDQMKIEKKVITYTSSIQIVMYTDGVLEAINKDEIVAEKKVGELAGKTWPLCDNPIDYLVEAEQQENQPDDMCVLLIQAH